jgi:hypothetical protein
MAVTEIAGLPPHPVSMTNGERTLTFDTPAELADYLNDNPGFPAWEFSWVGPVISAN